MNFLEYNILAQRSGAEFWFTIIIFVIIIVANAVKSISKASKDKKDMFKRQAKPTQRKSTSPDLSYEQRQSQRIAEHRKQAQLRAERMALAKQQRAAQLDQQRQQRTERLKRQNELVKQKEQKQRQILAQAKALSKRKQQAAIPHPARQSITKTPQTPNTSSFSVNDLSDMPAEQLRDLFVISEILGKPKALAEI